MRQIRKDLGVLLAGAALFAAGCGADDQRAAPPAPEPPPAAAFLRLGTIPGGEVHERYTRVLTFSGQRVHVATLVNGDGAAQVVAVDDTGARVDLEGARCRISAPTAPASPRRASPAPAPASPPRRSPAWPRA
jgi:hypothetical protein